MMAAASQDDWKAARLDVARAYDEAAAAARALGEALPYWGKWRTVRLPDGLCAIIMIRHSPAIHPVPALPVADAPAIAAATS
jgi:hypothetical protein